MNENINRTFFIHIKKNDISYINDLNTIKNLLENQIDDNVNINDFKFINIQNLIKTSYKNIGRYFKSNKQSICDDCSKYIKLGTIFKQLLCNHRFHVKCIDNKLKNDIYKKCSKCNTEQISITLNSKYKN